MSFGDDLCTSDKHALHHGIHELQKLGDNLKILSSCTWRIDQQFSAARRFFNTCKIHKTYLLYIGNNKPAQVYLHKNLLILNLLQINILMIEKKALQCHTYSKAGLQSLEMPEIFTWFIYGQILVPRAILYVPDILYVVGLHSLKTYTQGIMRSKMPSEIDVICPLTEREYIPNIPCGDWFSHIPRAILCLRYAL